MYSHLVLLHFLISIEDNKSYRIFNPDNFVCDNLLVIRFQPSFGINPSIILSILIFQLDYLSNSSFNLGPVVQYTLNFVLLYVIICW